MVNNNRIFPAIIIVAYITLFYFLKLDLIFLISLLFLMNYDLYKSKLLALNKLIYASFFFFISIYLNNVTNFSLNFFVAIFFVLFLFSFFVIQKYKKIIFIILLYLIFFQLHLLLGMDRSIVFLIILISFINDTSAYIFGNYFKGPLIIPNISPKKTWSGTLSSSFFSFLILYYLNYSLFFSFIVSLSFFFGDAFFSLFKRNFNLKDFSNLLNAHGGFLDRFDSVFFPIFLFFLYITKL